MPADEFAALMAGDKPFSSAWESALMACESLHLISENMKTMSRLSSVTDTMLTDMVAMRADLVEFCASIELHCDQVLERTRVVLKPSKTKKTLLLLTAAQRQRTLSADDVPPAALPAPLLPTQVAATTTTTGSHFQANLMSAVAAAAVRGSKYGADPAGGHFSVVHMTGKEQSTTALAGGSSSEASSTAMAALAYGLSDTLSIDAAIGSLTTTMTATTNVAKAAGNLSSSNSADLLSVSPIFQYSFDDRSLNAIDGDDGDEDGDVGGGGLDTPTTSDTSESHTIAPATDYLNGGLANINYVEFELAHDSPNATPNEGTTTAATASATGTTSGTQLELNEFDPLLDALEQQDLAEAAESAAQTAVLPFRVGGPVATGGAYATTSSVDMMDSLMDSTDGTEADVLVALPSPLKPTSAVAMSSMSSMSLSDCYRGFSTLDIPSIACNTGDFSAINTTTATTTTTNSDGQTAAGDKNASTLG